MTVILVSDTARIPPALAIEIATAYALGLYNVQTIDLTK